MMRILYTATFKKNYKALAKKYPSHKDDLADLYLLTINDKSDQASISDNELKNFIKAIQPQK
jgi:mRNA-degrading endonuclease YafQ of YafQ-DinJ toxin-antitoxin module